ncbi:Outer membrane protein TolC [Pricia antarctica]|uniref:Outer membrane protein TolC n=1 Tax=Pricia antarctica TaxID=641691 RepID=A0A1G7C1V1_9FLAO|nr:TolC family protein [Pricia antarctica]SDE33253.1 Outer membrane protein TolC [Pricia antarctica]
MKFIVLWILVFFTAASLHAQEADLDYFLKTAQKTDDSLYNTVNLQKIGQLQQQIILAQNKAPQIDALANVVVSPYFNNNGKAVDITTNPSPDAFGYDVGISNGGLYAAQIKVTQQLFNQAVVDNLQFQQRIKNEALALTYEAVYHNLKNNITRVYVTAYGYQLQLALNESLIAELENRLKVIEVLVKNGILLQSDYLLLRVTIDQNKINGEQVRNTLRESLRQLYAICAVPLVQNVALTYPGLVIMPEKKQFFYQKRFANDSLQLEADRKVFDNKYKPKISAYADGGLNAVQIPGIAHRIGASAGLQLTLPIYDGHQKQINAEQSMLQQENLQNSLKNKRQVKQNDLLSLTERIAAQNENLNLMEQQLKRQQIVQQLYKAKLVQGQVSVIDYLTVIQNYRMMENARIQMQSNLWLLQNQYNYLNW